MRRLILILTVFASIATGVAQDIQFSQFYAASMYLNPAFAGNTRQGRLAANYRNQWPSAASPFVSYAFGFDYNFRKANSGLGLLASQDESGPGGYTTTGLGLCYSYSLNIDRRHSVRAGIRASNVWSGIARDKLIFGDQLITNSESSVSYDQIKPNTTYLDFAGGALFYTSFYWVGLSFDHLNQPNPSVIMEDSQLPLKGSFHGGYAYPLTIDPKGRTSSKVTISFNYKAQRKWDQLDIGAYYTKNPIFIGAWYRGLPFKKNPVKGSGNPNREAFVFMFGVEARGVRVGYSYDLTISKLQRSTGGAHEMSLTYEFGSSRQKVGNRIIVVPCAKF